MSAGTLADAQGTAIERLRSGKVRYTVQDLVDALRRAGYGDDLARRAVLYLMDRKSIYLSSDNPRRLQLARRPRTPLSGS